MKVKNNKLRVIQDYEKLTTELQEQIKLAYPKGYSNHLIKFKNRHGDDINALPFETEDKIYMVRMTIKKAEKLVQEDEDFDDDGLLKAHIRERILNEQVSDGLDEHPSLDEEE